MSPRIQSAFVVCLCLFAVAPASFAATYVWVPKGATGTHNIVGQEIILTGAGQQVTLDLEMFGWDPAQVSDPLLATFQAAVDSSGYTSGNGVALNPLGWPATPALGAFQILKRCTINFLVDPNGAPCFGLGGECPGEVCIDDPQFVLSCCDPLPAVSTASFDYEFAATAQSNLMVGRADDGANWYGATLILDVPVGAVGTYTIGFLSDSAVTFMRRPNGQPITPINLIAAQITILCSVDADCNDGSACTDDSCLGGTCNNTNNFNDALFCCRPANGFLTPVNDFNPCSDDVCDPDTGTVTHPCLPFGTSCGSPALNECDAQDTCDGNCNCVDRNAPAGTTCGFAFDTLCTDPDTCDGAGLCDLNDEPVGTPCGNQSDTDCTDPNTCNQTGGCVTNHAPIGTPCEDGDFCTIGDACVAGGNCASGSANCLDDGVGCTDDSCDEVNDVCVFVPNDANCNNGQFCDGVEICDPQLDCVVQAGTVPVCDDLVGCTDDSCDEVNDVCVSDPNDANCDNGLFCDGSETCDALLDCQAGTAPNCDDGVGCTDDSCNEGTNSCDNIANDAVCDNGLFCDGAETCDVQLDCQAGVAPDCNDLVGCTDDSCDEVNDVCVNAANNATCNNGQFCDGVEICDTALDCVVQAGTVPDCNDLVGCTDDACDEVNDVCTNVANDGNCNNGQFCDGVEICDAQLDCVVQAGTVPDCDDLVGCTDDSCNEGTDSCDNIANNANCDNGVFCDGAETCDAALNCQSGAPPTCDDLVGCTDDSCNAGTDSCDNIVNNANCDNGVFCDGAETCDAALDCQSGTPPTCDDLVGCTDDSCNAGTDSCDNIANNANCNNGQFCDGVEICNAQLDCVVQAGTVPDCDDLVGCTDDSCDEVNDVCVNAASDANCDNGQFCDGVETCDAQLDCQAGVALGCSDSVLCTDDSCDEVNDVCVNVPNDANCDNGLFCDGAETCDAQLDCQAGVAPNGDDGIDCTDDSCDEVNDVVVNAPNDANCNNGQFCDGVEICDAALDCVVQAGTVPVCDDLVGCTDDACDEVNDVCTNDANDTNCNNGQFCDGVEICDAQLDCVVQAGSIPDCSDGVSCTDESCDEVNDVCVNAPNDANCNNGQFCDGVEICDAALDCVVQAGTVPNCDDSIDCTDDSCDEVNDVCVSDPNDALCPDDTLFCNGSEFCAAALGCEHTGSPCGGPCDEDNDVCLCDAPIVVAAGSRYLAITLQPADAGPQAIVIRGKCTAGVARYVGAPVPFYNEGLPGVGPESRAGVLVDDPANGVFLTPAEWGDPVYVTGLTLAPGSTYEIWADCGSPGNPAFSDVTTAVTYRFGDVDGNAVRNIDDVFIVLLAFKGDFLLTPEVTRSQTDLEGCSPNLLPNIADALWSIIGFQAGTFADVGCSNECPPCHPAGCDDGDACTADSCVIETGDCLHEPICP